jgi:hypothetical protein
MPRGPVLRRASIRIRFAHFDDVFLSMPVTDVLQMTMVQIVNVIPMANGSVATTWGRCANLRQYVDWERAWHFLS